MKPHERPFPELVGPNVVERGTHAALLAANGSYARTFRRAAGLPG